MTNTIPHDYNRLRPHHHQEMDQLQTLAVKPQAKRQARRRTHTSRPYKERLLNMAEARREIVTALKIHRASISTRHQHQRSTPFQQQQVLQQQRQEEEQQQVQMQAQAAAFHDRSQAAAAADEESSLAHTTMSYAAAAAASSFANNPLCSSPAAAHWIAAGSSYCSPPPILRHPCDIDLRPTELPPYTAAMGGLVELEHYQYQGGLERLVRSLPAQPLGLNLSFQGFGVSVDDGAKDDCEDLFGSGSLPLTQPSPAYSYSYSYSSPAVETATTHAYGHGSPALSAADAEKHSVIDAPAAAALVPALLDGGEMMMAQQASTDGEMQQSVEWSESAAADVAAWWSKIFESVESGQRHASRPNSEDVAAASGWPAEWWWLCGDDVVGVGEQGATTVTGNKPTPDVLGTMKHVDDGDGDYSCCYEGSRSRSDGDEDVTLPCMDDIGDTEERCHALD